MIVALALRLTVEILCPAAAPPELIPLLALELSRTPYAIVDTAPDLTIAVDATPCAPTSPLTLTFTPGPSPPPLSLPPTARARTLALLLADLLPPPPPPPPPPPSLDSTLPLGLSYLHRSHSHPITSGDGFRLSIPFRPRAIPHLTAALDLGLDELTSTTAVRVSSLRTGLFVGAYARLPRGLTTYAGLRAELAHSSGDSTLEEMSVTLRDTWSESASALLGAELAASSTIGLRVELEYGHTLASVDARRTYAGGPELPPPPDAVAVVDGSFLTLALGIYLR